MMPMKHVIYLWCIACLYELMHFWPTKALHILTEDEQDQRQKSTNRIQPGKPVDDDSEDDLMVLETLRDETLTLPGNTSNSTTIGMPQYFDGLSKDRLSFELKQFNHDQTWSERVILEILYHSLKGEHWAKSNNWLDESKTICSWSGITCQLPDAYYLTLNNEGKYKPASAHGISSIIPSKSIANRSTRAANGGSNSKSMDGEEEELIHYHDYANYFTPEKGAVVTKIELPSNNLTGTLPSELYMLPYLRILNLEGNQIEGAIPYTLGLCPKLRFLNLGNNRLSGTIPQQIANCTFLDELLLNHNQLTGIIPPLFTLLPRLLFLDLSYNYLEGSLPDSIGSMTLIEIVHLEHNRLEYSIPPHIKGMEKLRLLDVSDNELTGSIPTEIGHLSGLEAFAAENNRLTGTLPRELFLLGDLESVQLNHNLLQGTLPVFGSRPKASENPDENPDHVNAIYQEEFDDSEDLMVLPKLEKLFLCCNNLTGSLPTQLGTTLIGLRELDISHNLLTGDIPRSMADLKELRWLDISSNKISGTVPDVLANLIFLYHINMTNNELIGEVPETLCEKIWLNNGQVAMFGCDALLCPPGKWHPFGMASEHGGCTRCHFNPQNYYLGQTSCDGGDEEEVTFLVGDLDGDEEFSQREILHLLFLFTNGNMWGDNWKDWKNYRKMECELTGVSCDHDGQVTKIYLRGADLCGGCALTETECCRGIPTELGLLSSLEMLDLSLSSSLVGTIPESLGNLKELKILNLSGSQFITGTIPKELGNCKSLRVLSLTTMGLTGEIPSSLANLKQLITLDIGANNLSGTLPHELGQLKNLAILEAPFNDFTGFIPESFGNLGHLEQLLLQGNKMSGSLPETIGLCSSLRMIDLRQNNHTGSIPISLGNIGPSLEGLYLAGNSFSGTIPKELGLLSSLKYLNLSSNALTGTIPVNLGYLAQLHHLDLSSNIISGDIPEEIGLLKKLSLLDLSGNRYV